MSNTTPPVAVVEEVHDKNENVPFYTAIDVEKETHELLEFFRPYIEAERALTPSLVFFRDDDKVAQIICRQLNEAEDEVSDKAKLLVEPLFLWPGLMANTIVLGFENTVMLTNRGLTRCMVISTITRAGIFSQVFPIRVDERGVAFEDDVQVEGQAEPAEFKHMLAVFGHTYNAPMPANEVIEWLSSLGHEIELFGDWTISNLQARIDQ